MPQNLASKEETDKTDASASSGRPFVLDTLFRPLTTLASIGPRNGKLLEKLVDGPKILDLLWHMPIDFVDRRKTAKISDLQRDHIFTLTVTVVKHTPAPRRNLPYRVLCRDETGTINLVFFNANKDWLHKQLPINGDVVISGKIDFYQGKPQMVHPDAIGTLEDLEAIQRLDPIYPLTAGITHKTLSKAMTSAQSAIKELPDWLDEAHKLRENWPSFAEALQSVHHLQSERELDPLHPCRARLAYDELLAGQLALALVRYRQKRLQGRAYSTNGPYRDRLMEALPFTLTGAQQKSIKDIDEDMGAELKMLRLLQGDVGSGKTVVAAIAMLNAIESGAQAALMAPTEILARQHAESLAPWLEAAGVRHVILTGRDKGKSRDVLLQQIASGAAQVVIGTHALFQDNVIFDDLGLAVIDEQHRFGVQQRMKLAEKGRGVDTLVMTATPIPRTLTLTAYGDMDVSRLDEKPPGRKPIDTRLISNEKIDDMIDGLKRQTKEGARAYWVCPLVEESEVMDLAAAEERYEILQAHFGERVGLVHGRMKGEEKDAVMEKFVTGDIDILVATTVIEVGVNVPEATIMIIEHAERFGLSQLHQLRGRVGRGADKSFCFLLYATPVSETAKERLSTMRETEDGFKIAEKDLKLRGGGDILGTRQSGLPDFKAAILPPHEELLATARDDARLIIDKDPELKSERGTALRTLLYLFERDQAIRYLRSG